ncbi:MAG: chromophore lyase CpcT/CpeT [Chitinophagales bacterium]|nr:chromophore lyase CpcT/CpeT [Chitinophagales bacterium]
MKQYYFLVGLLLSIGWWSCSSQMSRNSHNKGSVEELLRYMEGSYNTLAQSQRDTNYFHISLEMHRIWQKRSDGHWLYVEQAMAGKLDKPYRQRIYRVAVAEKGFVSEVYELKTPQRYIQQYKNPIAFAQLTPDSLVQRKGCEVWLHKEGDKYVGETHLGSCESSLRGAKYATSQVTISAQQLESWDRGFDEKKQQVWGATAGPYLFVKQ